MESATTLLWKPQDMQLSSRNADGGVSAAQYRIVGEADLPAMWSYLFTKIGQKRQKQWY
jgi:hypothetical protein